MITYGHEKFIEEAIKGVLMQECNFEVELVIANDCSPDQTDEIISDIIQNHPLASWIKYIRHEKNIGIIPNFIFAMQECKGKYIALLDGDDYWLDPLKLQKQVDFLEANPEYVMHSGAAQVLKNKSISTELYGFAEENIAFEIKDFFVQNPVVSCTVMFRNCLTTFPKVFQQIIFGDWFLYVRLMSSTGLRSFRSNETYSVYRLHQGGVMSNFSSIKYFSAYIFQIIQIKKEIGYAKYPEDVLKILNWYIFQNFKFQINDKQYTNALLTFLLNLRESNFKTPFKEYLRFLKNIFY